MTLSSALASGGLFTRTAPDVAITPATADNSCITPCRVVGLEFSVEWGVILHGATLGCRMDPARGNGVYRSFTYDADARKEQYIGATSSTVVRIRLHSGRWPAMSHIGPLISLG